ncbi:MAG: ATP-binding protein [Bacteroidota bacterium]|nr:ATP-binding protein [Bacteroidota bacterium]
MKALKLTVLIALGCCTCFAQNIKEVTRLKKALITAKEDTFKVKLLIDLCNNLGYATEEDSTIFYANQSLKLAQKINYSWGIAQAQLILSNAFTTIGNYPLALEYGFKARSEFEKLKDTIGITSTLGYCFKEQGDYENEMKYTALDINMLEVYYSNKERINSPIAKSEFNELKWSLLAFTYQTNNKHLDSSILYAEKALSINEKPSDLKYDGLIYVLGNNYLKLGKYDNAMHYFKLALGMAINHNIHKDIIESNNGIARVFIQKKNLDSAEFYCKSVINNRYKKFFPRSLLETSNILATIYESQNKPDSAFKYFKQVINLKDTLYNKGNLIAIQNLLFKEDQKKQELEAAKITFQNRLKIYGLAGVLIVLLLVAFFLWRNNQHKQKAYYLLQNQKKETDYQKEKVENTLIELKSTQSHLIQSEKMASLGELTAGIAHEIQNPLNFVNNFSDVNFELIEELKSELLADNKEDAILIADDIKENEQKINHHGKRADAIVKGMLQHSRASAGKKELTDINALADEYLRLSYHGLRAKDKDFNADFKTDFDESIRKIEVVPQDIGRVLLNLFNNAFYAASLPSIAGFNKNPTIWVSTKRISTPSGAGGLEIRVRDNGPGIPQNIVDKIFQPFFTTKPTGQGTGLGLSLSYDIVKAHGGEIKVETKEGEGAEFIITLPIV